MKEVFFLIRNAILDVLDMFFKDDLAVLSDEMIEILRVPEDAELFRVASNSKERPITITLSTGKTITLI